MSVTDRRLTLGVDRDALGTEYLPAHERRRELVFNCQCSSSSLRNSGDAGQLNTLQTVDRVTTAFVCRREG